MRRSLKQPQTLLDLASPLSPKKIADECIGDRRELIDKMAEEGASHWAIQLETIVGACWGFVFAVGELGKLAVIWRLLTWLMR